MIRVNYSVLVEYGDLHARVSRLVSPLVTKMAEHPWGLPAGYRHPCWNGSKHFESKGAVIFGQMSGVVRRKRTKLAELAKKTEGDPILDYLVAHFFRHPITPVLHPKELLEGYVSVLRSILPSTPWVRVVRGGVSIYDIATGRNGASDNYVRTYLSLFDAPPSIRVSHRDTRKLMSYIVNQACHGPVVVRVCGIQSFGITKSITFVKLLLYLEFH